MGNHEQGSTTQIVKHLCRVCSKPFLTISSRNKHERVNRKCSQVSIVKVGEADAHDEGQGTSVEYTLNAGLMGAKQCNFCHHEFTTEFWAKQHLCLLSPSVGPEYIVLKLVEEDVGSEFKRLHNFNSSYQNLRTCLISSQAVPGVFPLIFTGPKVAGRSASSLLARLRGLGSVGSQAYATLHEALKEVPELRLPLCFTIYLPGGEVVSLGKDLTVPTNKKELRDLLVTINGGEIIVSRGGVAGHGDIEQAVNNGGISGHSECHGGVWWEQTRRDLAGGDGEGLADASGSGSDGDGEEDGQARGDGDDGGGPPDDGQGDTGGSSGGGGGDDGGGSTGGGGGDDGGGSPGGGGDDGGGSPGGGGDDGGGSPGGGGDDGGGSPGGGGGYGDQGLHDPRGNLPNLQQLRLNSFLRHPEYMNDTQLQQVLRVTLHKLIFLYPGTSHVKATV